MTPYYEHAGDHMPLTEQHRRRIGASQKVAWDTKRKRMPIGSKWTDLSGYVRVKVISGKGKWKLEHVLAMENELGRPLRAGEIVHHINGVKTDNGIANLYLCRSHEHHADVERNLLTVVRALLADGVVRFNFASGTYER